MLDFILKCLPLLVFVVPLLTWLDKAKRFSHRRKYYTDRLEAVKTYLAETRRTDTTVFEKNCAAQALAASEKISYPEVEYLFKHHPERFFILVRKLLWARQFIEAKEINGEVKMTSASRKQRLTKVRNLMIGTYLSSIIVLKLNNIAVFLIGLTGIFHPFTVESWVIVLGQIICMFLGIMLATGSGILYLQVDAAIEIYDELNVVKVDNTLTGFRFFPEP